jgi:hypothetical protein
MNAVTMFLIILFVSWIDRERKTGWDKFRTYEVICTLWETWELYQNYKLVSLCRPTFYWITLDTFGTYFFAAGGQAERALSAHADVNGMNVIIRYGSARHTVLK